MEHHSHTGTHTEHYKKGHRLTFFERFIKNLKKETHSFFSLLSTIFIFVLLSFLGILFYLVEFFKNTVKPALIEAAIMSVSKPKEFFTKVLIFFGVFLVLTGYIMGVTII